LKDIEKEYGSILNGLRKLGLIVDGKDINKIDKDIKQLKRYTTEVNKYKTIIETYKDQVWDVSKDKINDELEKLNKEISSLEDEKNKLTNENENLNKKIGELDNYLKRLKNLRKELEKYDKYSKELDKLKKDEEILGYVYEIFKEGSFPVYFVNEVILPELNELINKYLHRFDSPYTVKLVKSFSKGSDTIKVEVYERNVKRYYSSLSGGESTILGLAFRLAFGELISRFGINYTLDFLILDEALAHLDEDHKYEVMNILCKMVEDGIISQVIVITHDRDIREYGCWRTIIEVEKRNDISKIRNINVVG